MRASRRVGWMPTFNQWPIGRQSQRQAVLPQHDGRHEKPIAEPHLAVTSVDTMTAKYVIGEQRCRWAFFGSVHSCPGALCGLQRSRELTAGSACSLQ